MGAWGCGPFDSDNALDYLGDVADKANAQYDEEYHVVSGTANPDRVESVFRETLTNPQYLRNSQRFDEMYATAGIVVVQLLGNVPADIVGGGEPNEEPLNLDSDCGFAALLTEDQARFLAPFAETALTKILEVSDSGEGMLTEYPQLYSAVRRLREILDVSLTP